MVTAAIDHRPGDRFLGAASGHTFTLGPFVARGGEGAIYTLDRKPGKLAKIYHEVPSRKHREKIDTITAIQYPPLRKVAALPDEVLIDAKGQLAGFVMPEVVGARPLHQLITPQDRLAHFPHLSYANLVTIAFNLAHIVDTTHAAGIVIADVNTRNLLVSADGRVHLVDCDSVQLGRGIHHRCEVAVEDYLAPELHGWRLDRWPRTAQHDAFALAAILFELLIVGRHPYSGQWQGEESLTVPEAIRAGRHALPRWRGSSGPTIFENLGIKPDSILSPAAIKAFRAAFTRPYFIRKRPTPAQWRVILDDLARQLVTCAANPQHQFTPGTKTCPWCTIEREHTPLFMRTQRVVPLPIPRRSRLRIIPVAVAFAQKTFDAMLPLVLRLLKWSLELPVRAVRHAFRHRPRLAWSLVGLAVIYVLASVPAAHKPPIAASPGPSAVRDVPGRTVEPKTGSPPAITKSAPQQKRRSTKQSTEPTRHFGR